MALSFLGLFATATGLLYGATYWVVGRESQLAAEEAVEGEMRVFRVLANRGGWRAVVREVETRSRTASDRFYYVGAMDWTRIVGTLPSREAKSAWDERRSGGGGWVEVEGRTPEGGRKEGSGQVYLLRGGVGGKDRWLLVGRWNDDWRRVRASLGEALGWLGGVTLLMGLAGGILASRRAAVQVEGISRACRAIVEGDLTRRAPVEGGGEFARLGEHVNRMLDRLNELMEGMRAVSGDIAHDMRSPLTRIRNRLVVLTREAGKEGAGKEDWGSELEACVKEVDGALKGFGALLQIARAESRHVRESMEETDLTGLVRDVGELFEPTAEEAGGVLELEIEEGVRGLGRRELLFQALTNLLENALKYGLKGGGVVRLGVSCEGEEAHIWVKDDGPGIEPRLRERAMRRFVRLRHEERGGAGLGLALASAIARLHGGVLELRGREPGLEARMRFPLSGVGLKSVL